MEPLSDFSCKSFSIPNFAAATGQENGWHSSQPLPPKGIKREIEERGRMGGFGRSHVPKRTISGERAAPGQDGQAASFSGRKIKDAIAYTMTKA
jgi:hypothetical protein